MILGSRPASIYTDDISGLGRNINKSYMNINPCGYTSCKNIYEGFHMDRILESKVLNLNRNDKNKAFNYINFSVPLLGQRVYNDVVVWDLVLSVSKTLLASILCFIKI